VSDDFRYSISSRPTLYRDTMFRSRLEARWAAFFDLIGWAWQYEPYDLDGWTPDFLVRFDCSHSECGGYHELLVEVKPFTTIEQFSGHPCMDYSYGSNARGRIPADASAAFGNTPRVSHWEMGHGHGGGVEIIENWTGADIDVAWERAGNATRWNPPTGDAGVGVTGRE